ncbi:MAG: hypothetical protein Q9183_003227 [Haloplaca sp. 2 TL-2023]
MAGGAACYFNGLVYPDDGTAYALGSAWTQFLRNSNDSASVSPSSTATMAMDIPTVGSTPPPMSPGVMTRAEGWNYSTATGTGLATLSGGYQIPNPTATGPYTLPTPSAPFVASANKTMAGNGQVSRLADTLVVILLLVTIIVIAY